MKESSNQAGDCYGNGQMIKTQSYMTQMKKECEIKHDQQNINCKKKLKIGKKESFQQELQMKRSKSWDVNNRTTTK